MKRFYVLCILILMIAGYAAATEPNGLVVLLTDYGADSIYVGALKGAILSKAPSVRIETLTNSVPSFDVVTGAYLLAEGCQIFPKGTVFCCVVDPGVGTERSCIAVAAKTGHIFVGPDNGLLSLAARQYGVEEMRQCTNTELWRIETVSKTFQGRDIFGPVSASLASGIPFEKVEPILEKIVELDVREARIEHNSAVGFIIRIDEYGNVVTNITAQLCANLGIMEGDMLEVTIGETQYHAPFVRTYGSVAAGERLVLLQSAGLVELAANMKSLAELVNAKPHA